MVEHSTCVLLQEREGEFRSLVQQLTPVTVVLGGAGGRDRRIPGLEPARLVKSGRGAGLSRVTITAMKQHDQSHLGRKWLLWLRFPYHCSPSKKEHEPGGRH